MPCTSPTPVSLMWTETEPESAKIAKPRSDVTLSVVKWSKLWRWVIEKDGNRGFVARGVSDSIDDAVRDAETVWSTLVNTIDDFGVEVYPPYDRRPRLLR